MSEYRPNSEARPPASLPEISEAVLRRFLNDPPDFETLYSTLQKRDPQLAGWLLAKTERIAPANAAEKERYGTVALCLYGMLVDQELITDLNAKFNEASAEEPATVNPEIPPAAPAA